MAQGNSGSFTLTGSQNFAVIIYWSETYNESANTHVVSITAAQLVSYNWYGFTYYPSGTLSINGSTVVHSTLLLVLTTARLGRRAQATISFRQAGQAIPPRRGLLEPSPAMRMVRNL